MVRAYGNGEIRIESQSYKGAVIVSATALIHEPTIESVAALASYDAQRVLALKPELVLLGTGSTQVFPDGAFSMPYLKAGVGVEVMNTGAACRTYNVLVSEQRRVVAMLLA